MKYKKQKNTKNKKQRIIFLSLLSVFMSALIFISVFVFVAIKDVDPEKDRELFENVSSEGTLILTDRNGEEYAIVNGTSYRRYLIDVSESNMRIKDLFIAVEDRDFYNHRGVNIKRTALAILNAFTKSRPEFGASTITQQVIKNMSGDRERTVRRKISEIYRSLCLEKSFSKDEIINVYLNIIPFGENTSGIEMASKHFFGKQAKDLSISEAVTLIGMANAPTKYNPRKNTESCLKKRDTLLKYLKNNNDISDNEYKIAVSQPLKITENDDLYVDSWFTETLLTFLVRDLALEKNISELAAKSILFSGGYTVKTTVDREIQNILDSYFSLESNMPLEIRQGLNASMVIIDPTNGGILGIIGSAGKKDANRIMNYALVNRAPGSALKPLALYAPMIDIGLANYSTVFDDVPTEIKARNGVEAPYPKNSPDEYDGLITLSEALVKSKNTVAVKLYRALGKETVFNHLRDKMGFSTLVKSEKGKKGTLTDLAESPLALGQLTHGISLIELAAAYSVFNNNGVRNDPICYTELIDKNGKAVITNAPVGHIVFKKSTAKIMNRMLMEVVNNGTAKNAKPDSCIDVAGKTGTSGGDKNRLFIGYTPDIIAGIWFGYGNKENEIGHLSKSHLTVWKEIMEKVAPLVCKSNHFDTEGLELLPYCRCSGQLYSQVCMHDPRNYKPLYGYFTNDNKPERLCDVHKLYYVNGDGTAISQSELPGYEKIALLQIADRKMPDGVNVADDYLRIPETHDLNIVALSDYTQRKRKYCKV